MRWSRVYRFSGLQVLAIYLPVEDDNPYDEYAITTVIGHVLRILSAVHCLLA